MTRVCWRPVIQRYEEFNLCKSNCETKKKNLPQVELRKPRERREWLWRENWARSQSLNVQRERLKAYPSRKNVFPITTKDLKNFKGKQAHFVLRFKGQLIYRLVTLGSFAGPGHLNQLLLTLFRMKCYAHSLSFKSERVWNFEISYCWFAPDVMAAMLVVSPLVTQ